MSESNPSPLLIEPHFLPSVSWIWLVAQHQEVVLDVSSNYIKSTYRNRAHIPGPNGLLRLSVPLEHGRGQKMPMHTVQISYAEDWQKIIWQTIQSTYRRSPFFEYYEDLLTPFFVKKTGDLMTLNMGLLRVMLKALEEKLVISTTESYIAPGTAGYIDMREVVHPRKDNPLQLQFRPYTQVFSDRHTFMPDMSALDVIFNKGKFSAKELVI